MSYIVKTKNGEFKIKKGEQFFKIAEELQKKNKYTVLAVKFNNEIKELWKKVHGSGYAEPVDVTSTEGMRIYRRALLFIIYIALKRKFKKSKLVVHHSIGSGLYFEIKGVKNSEKNIEKLKAEMKKIIEEDLLFEKITLSKFDAIKYFDENDEKDKAILFKYRKKTTVKVYKCGEYINYFYEYMPPSTGYIELFDVIAYDKGFVLLHPNQSSPDKIPEFKPLPKLSATFIEYKKWLDILNIQNVGELNSLIAKGVNKSGELIRIAEALHEKKYANIADQIMKRKHVRLICLAGPSSSGKTTSAKRIALQLKVNGKEPLQISLDDYYMDYEKIPLTPEGKKDLESIEALDLDLLNRNLKDLIEGKEVELPRYNFVTGKREWTGKKVKAGKNQPIIIEGIHGLNEKLTESIPRDQKFKVYVSALIQMNLDEMNRIPTTDTRLIRRIVRDYNFRGATALRTLQLWPEVRKGEEANIFPYQEEADIMFNSYLIYELPILKLYAEPLLLEIDNTLPEYTEAKRLLRFLDYFLPLPAIKHVPNISVLREFIGDSTFEY
ncbi:uridine kinase [Marinitoga piezophila KA3]|uniref:Uridine kinase n=1 Tax=Marinitoga piezophila (strain DSM 14283 / JCM 11233 / KA3) TaxID=443254 RepID=H2J5U9_MARPK|nr:MULTISPECIES: nucleoside kinase [Marinitoga]AEX86168.1 uridine kinase [Marinitoga piezophila KA3]